MPLIPSAMSEPRQSPGTGRLPADITVYCPFPSTTYPGDSAGIDDDAVDWCLRHRLFALDSVSARMGCVTGIAHALPSAPDSTIRAATRHMYWGSAFDDHCDHHPDLAELAAEVGELQRVMYAGPAAAGPAANRWVASLRALRDEVESVLTADDFDAFVCAHIVWLSAQLWATSLQHQDRTPEVGEWLRLRWAKSGVATLIPFTSATCGSNTLTSRQRAEPAVAAFTEAVMMACALLNDLASAAKEITAGTGVANLLSVLAGPDTDTVDAVAALRLYEQTVILAHRLQQQLLTDPRPQVARYAHELPRWIPAGIEWASTTARYLQPSSASAGFMPPRVQVADSPQVWDPDDLTPPTYPEIAWWWEALR